MSNTTTVFISVPVSKKPDKEGWYNVLNQEGEILPSMRYYNGKELDYRSSEVHWLKPIEVSADSPVQKAIDYFSFHNNIDFNREDVIACLTNTFLNPDLARSARIKDLESIRDKHLNSISAMAKEISDLKKEREKIASDAFDAGALRMFHETDDYPDKETYLNSINNKTT